MTRLMSTQKGKQSRSLSSDERVLWSAVTQSIPPLRKRPHLAQKPANEKSETAKSHTKQKSKQKLQAVPSNKTIKVPTTPASVARLERKLKRRVARGRQT